MIDIPKDDNDAVKSEDGVQRKGAIDKELTSLQNHQVHDAVPISSPPSAFKATGSRWVYKVEAGNSFKARLLDRGWGQRPGIDSGGTLEPVCRIGSQRLFLTIATERNWDGLQFNVHRVCARRG